MSNLEISIWALGALVFLALVFDFMNGFHDAANAIATVVSTGVLKPQTAVMMAAFFNFVAIFVVGLKVATTIGKGTIEPSVIDHYVIFGALIGAIVWNVITWYYGIPSSSSHALIGGLVGAAVAKSGTGALISGGLIKTVTFIVVAPLLGFVLGSVIMLIVSWVFVKSTPRKVDGWFRRLQLLSAAGYSLGHGGNDAQKTMGIIWMLLIASGHVAAGDKAPPTWVIVSCYGAISFGTLFGGWRIVKTMGQKITKLKPVGGFCAETGGAITLLMASFWGFHHSHHHRRDRRCRFGTEDVGRALGCSGQYRVGLDLHHSCFRLYRGSGVVGWQAHHVIRKPGCGRVFFRCACLIFEISSLLWEMHLKTAWCGGWRPCARSASCRWKNWRRGAASAAPPCRAWNAAKPVRRQRCWASCVPSTPCRCRA
jgi:PiT family inorganic phosphate transporter